MSRVLDALQAGELVLDAGGAAIELSEPESARAAQRLDANAEGCLQMALGVYRRVLQRIAGLLARAPGFTPTAPAAMRAAARMFQVVAWLDLAVLAVLTDLRSAAPRAAPEVLAELCYLAKEYALSMAGDVDAALELTRPRRAVPDVTPADEDLAWDARFADGVSAAVARLSDE